MPLTIATPITIASEVSDEPELAPEQVLQRDPDHEAGATVKLVHRLQHLGGCRAFLVEHDQAVGEVEDPVGDRGRARVVRDHHDRLPVGVGRSRAGASRISSLERESRLPVGSSAKTTVGWETSERATATRCCWPPESSEGRWSSRSLRPTFVDQLA